MNALAKLEDVGCVEVEMIYRDDAEWCFGSGSWDEWADGLRDLARTCGVTVKVLRYEPSEEYEGANYVSVVGHPGALAGFLSFSGDLASGGPGTLRPVGSPGFSPPGSRRTSSTSTPPPTTGITEGRSKAMFAQIIIKLIKHERNVRIHQSNEITANNSPPCAANSHERAVTERTETLRRNPGLAGLPAGLYETGKFHPSPQGWVHGVS